MSILEKLTIKNLQKNKHRTIVTILGVMLSSALILAVVGMVTSFQKMVQNIAIADTGNYHDMYEQVPTEALSYISENQHVKEYFYSEKISPDKVGEERFENYENYPHYPYHIEDYDRLDKLPDRPGAAYNIYVVYDDPKNIYEIEENILETLKTELGSDINVRTNMDLLRAYGVISGNPLISIYYIAGIIIAIIVVTSIMVIRNSFSISATERTRQFGMLSSIGATPRQIRHSVIFEGVIIASIGISLGILLGLIAIVVLLMIINYLARDIMLSTIEFSLPIWVFPFTIGLSFITILLSCLWPAIRASRISAVEAIRNNQDIKIKTKRLRTSKLTSRIFGIGGVIAAKNLKRSRKKYRTTVISIVLSVATFIGLSSFITYGKKTIDLEYRQMKADIFVGGANQKYYKSLIDRFNIDNYAYYFSAPTENTNLFVMNEAAFAKFATEAGVNTENYDQVAIVNNQGMTYNDGTYKIETTSDFQEGKNFTAELSTYNCDVTTGVNGKHWNCSPSAVKATPIDIKITKVTDVKPLGFENSFQVAIFVSEKYFQSEILQSALREPMGSQFYAADLSNLDEVDAYLKEFNENQTEFEHMYYANFKENQEQMQRVVLLMGIFLYGFVTVVTLIGVTNIFNTITTNIALRAKEFAMLKSVGMTRDEFNRMIRLESLMYAGKALVIGLPLGLLLSYGFYKSIANSVDFGFIFPYSAILISIIAVALLISIIMHYSVHQVEKQNIIETIRSENI